MKNEQDNFETILHRRAQHLSRPVEEKREKTTKLIVFSLGEEFYGLGAEYAREIVHAERIAVVPCAPDFIEGVINLRGEIISVINLAKILNIHDKTRIGERWVIIVGAGSIEAALHVDFIKGVFDVPQSFIEPPLATLEQMPAQYLKGEARVDDMLVGILDLENILASKKEGRTGVENA